MTPRDFFTPLSMLLALALAAGTIAGFILVPAGTSLPVHWGINGQPDSFLPRDLALLLLPGIFLGVIALMYVVIRSAPTERVAGARHGLRAVVPGLLALALVIQFATILIGLGQAVDMVRVIVLAAGLLLVVVGNVLPKSRPNSVSGMRLPWTMSDPANWQATNRLVGLLLLLGGAIMAIAAVLTGNPYILAGTVGLGVIVPVIAGTAYSYRLSRG